MGTSTPFLQDFDTILNGILTDWQNQFPDADTSKGSLIFIKSACLASALWGLSKKDDWVAKQIFPDTADLDYLIHHGAVRGLPIKPGELQSDYITRLLAYLQQPPAGGNAADYITWAEEVAGVKSAYCVPMGQGYGTVDIIIVADPTLNGGSEIPTQVLLDAVFAFIDPLRPVTAKWIRVLAVVLYNGANTDVTMATTGNCNKIQTQADITSYMSALTPGQPLYLSQLINLALKNGATNATISAPAADIIPDAYHMVRPGVINVT